MDSSLCGQLIATLGAFNPSLDLHSSHLHPPTELLGSENRVLRTSLVFVAGSTAFGCRARQKEKGEGKKKKEYRNLVCNGEVLGLIRVLLILLLFFCSGDCE